jgi:hypothetical protein
VALAGNIYPYSCSHDRAPAATYRCQAVWKPAADGDEQTRSRCLHPRVCHR